MRRKERGVKIGEFSLKEGINYKMMVAVKSFKKGDKQAKSNSFSTPELVLKVLFKAEKT